MSRKKVFLAAVLINAASAVYAQDAAKGAIGIPENHARRTEHFIGVQLNELIRQVTLSDVTSTARQNPYLLTYAENSIRSNWGVRAGLGLQVRSARGMDPTSGIDTSSKVEAIWVRVGALRTIYLTRKLATGIGIDLVYSNVERQSNNGGFTGFGSSTKIVTYGGGPVATLKYQFTEHIALGTETSLYYLRGEERARFGNDRPLIDFTFNLPVAIYFIIRL